MRWPDRRRDAERRGNARRSREAERQRRKDAENSRLDLLRDQVELSCVDARRLIRIDVVPVEKGLNIPFSAATSHSRELVRPEQRP